MSVLEIKRYTNLRFTLLYFAQTATQTHTHIGPIALPRPLKWSIIRQSLTN